LFCTRLEAIGENWILSSSARKEISWMAIDEPHFADQGELLRLTI
jgi:hypothetical protein